MSRLAILAFALLFYAPEAQAQGSAQSPTPAFSSVRPVLYVKDIRKSTEFFRRIPGVVVRDFIVSRSKGGVATLEAADDPYGATVAFGSHSVSLQRAQEIQSSGGRIDVSVADVTALHKDIAALGIPISKFVPVQQGGVFCFSITDPDGHEFLFLPSRAPSQ